MKLQVDRYVISAFIGKKIASGYNYHTFMPNNFHGQQREKALSRLVDEWLPGGRPVAILQGFPGCGKSQLAVSVAAKAANSIDPIEPQADSADPVLDLFIDLALALDAKGIPSLLQEFDKGGQTSVKTLGTTLLEIIRHYEILIVLDEFQRLLPNDSTVPPAPWPAVVEQLNNSMLPLGRLLLISNRAIKAARWCESCHVEEVRGLPDQEAEALFSELLESKGLAEKVPPNQRLGIVHRLSGNPRALKTLVYALRTDSLNELFSDAPDLSQTGDVVLDPRLLEEFERELLERALPKLETNLLKFMRWLSVHRIPFQKEALAQFTGGQETPESLRRQLFDRFLLEQVHGGDVPHQLAREISVSRLRPEKGEWVQAHNLAANYHMRRFEARRLSGASTLPASYAELRHHLYEAGRIDEIHKASERLTKYALSQIGLTTPVPTNKEALEERIALLSAIPGEDRPKVLEYHLAKCFVKRGGTGDKENALKHARLGTGRHPHAAAWLLRLNLEFELHGIDTALPVVHDALRNVGPDEDASPIYQRGAELLVKKGRLDDAITLLEKGLAIPEVAKQAMLYQPCAELLVKKGRLDDAITLLEKGLAVPVMANQVTLYQPCAELLVKKGRLDDAITLLEKGLAVPVMANQVTLYHPCAELLVKKGRLDDAITLLEKGIQMVPADQRVILYQTEIELVGKTGDCLAVEQIVARGLAAIPASAGRHKIAETGLRVVITCGGADAVTRLVNLGPPSQLDDQQRALADYMRARTSGDWLKAFEIVHKAHENFPRYIAFLLHEADARVALGQPSEAYALLTEYDTSLGQGPDNPMVWLKAFVSLVAGHSDEASSLSAVYAPNNYNPAVTLNEVEMLRLWSATPRGGNRSLSENFPGAAEYLRRNGPQAPSAAMPSSAPASKRRSILAVATEWHSAHGGVSTFNRELCRAFAKEGHQVWCYVPDAKAEEIAQAKDENNVSLLSAPREAHSNQDARLRNRPALPLGAVPDLIISHDRITGPAAASLVENHFPNSRHILFIHTAPKQIEWFKEQGDDSTATGTIEPRRQLQISLARKAYLTAGVGPKLQQAIGNELHALTPPKTAVEFLPGLQIPFRAASPPPANECLVLGRAEDADLKGLDIAARAMAKLLATPYQTINPMPVLVIRGAPIGTGDILRNDLMRKTQLGANHLHIREYSSDVDVVRRDMLSSALVLMPSRTEGFGLAALEAIALGIPVLISDQSGLADMLNALVSEHAKKCVVHVSADLETDATAWERKIDFVLSDKSAAFARASELRDALVPHLSWQKSVRGLIETVSLLSVLPGS